MTTIDQIDRMSRTERVGFHANLGLTCTVIDKTLVPPRDMQDEVLRCAVRIGAIN